MEISVGDLAQRPKQRVHGNGLIFEILIAERCARETVAMSLISRAGDEMLLLFVSSLTTGSEHHSRSSTGWIYSVNRSEDRSNE
eukprot:IDg16572t1